jgi:hypothetical protein
VGAHQNLLIHLLHPFGRFNLSDLSFWRDNFFFRRGAGGTRNDKDKEDEK